MREILFRGKRTDDSEWVQGYIIVAEKDTPYIIPSKSWAHAPRNSHSMYSSNFYRVDPATVGQYTGVNDINNVQMVEDDIVNVLIGKLSPFAEPVGFNAVVVFRDGAFGFKYYRGVVEEFTPFASCYKPNVTFTVIGNIHDNAELMGDI